MKVLIIGADGQLGSDLCRVIPSAEQVPLTIKELDVTDRALTQQVIAGYRPAVVVNTAAYHKVDDCEDLQALAFAVNDAGAGNVAEACRAAGAALVHFSTDYVFRGDKATPYTEEDRPDPRTVYGRSKLAGEERIRAIMPQHYLVRSAGLYGVAGCLGKGGGNFVDNIIAKAKRREDLMIVGDEFVSPTYSRDLAEKLYELIKTGKYGLYHLVNQGACSWYEFGKEICRLLGLEVQIDRITESDRVNKPKARRPKYSVLASVNLKRTGLKEMRPWPEALRAYLKEKGEEIK